jgi:hypothetical protein
MEKSPSGGCQLGNRCSDTKAWAHHVGTHGQDPMKYFEPRSMMQEHRSLTKRASAWSKEKTAGEHRHLNFEIF